MDICSDNINDIHALCMNTLESTHEVDKLGVDVTKFLKIQEAREDDLISSSQHKRCEFQNSKSHYNKITTQTPEKCLSKHPTFPCSSKTLSSQDAVMGELSTPDDNVTSRDPSGLRFTSLPVSICYCYDCWIYQSNCNFCAILLDFFL